MSNDLTTMQPKGVALPAAFANAKPARAFQGRNDIETGSEGIDGSYGVLKYAGKVFAIQLQGQNRPFIRKDDGTARGSVDVVFIRTAPHKAKTYYEGFKEGSKDKPICWSNDGQRPDPAVPQPPSLTCASCPKNVFGSRITDEGKQAKACGDHKRTAVIIDPALALETFGMPIEEPLLLRIPAASLNDFGNYSETMKHQGFSLPSIVTRVSFEIGKNYPKLKFEAIRPLNDAEGDIADLLREQPAAIRIVADSPVEDDTGPEKAEVTPPGNFIPPPQTAPQQGQQIAPPVTGAAQPPQQQQQQNVVPMNIVPRPTPQQQAEAMVPDADAPKGDGNFDADLDDEIKKLMDQNK